MVRGELDSQKGAGWSEGSWVVRGELGGQRRAGWSEGSWGVG